MVINGGASTFTNSLAVTLTLTADDHNGSGVDKMVFSHYRSSSLSLPEAYVSTKAWTFISYGTSTKTVYARFRE